MYTRSYQEIIKDIRAFEPSGEEYWLPCDDLLEELWTHKITTETLKILFEVFERYPEDDGAGVLFSIVHGVESLGIPYEEELNASFKRQPSHMAKTMIRRIENAKKNV